MKFALTLLSLVFWTGIGHAQIVQENIRFDAGLGSHFLHGQLSDGYKISARPWNFVSAGMTYDTKRNYFIRVETAMDMNRAEEGTPEIWTDYFRGTVGAGYDFMKIFKTKSRSNPGSSPTFKDKFRLDTYMGVGLSAMLNKRRYPADYGRRIHAMDYMMNITWAIIPSYKITPSFSVFARASFTAHIRQEYTFDMNEGRNNPLFDGGFMNAALGVSYRPFSSTKIGRGPRLRSLD
jgi:hypothetical protein